MAELSVQPKRRPIWPWLLLALLLLAVILYFVFGRNNQTGNPEPAPATQYDSNTRTDTRALPGQ